MKKGGLALFVVGLLFQVGCANKLTSISFKADNGAKNVVTITAPGATVNLVTEQKNNPVVVPSLSDLKNFIPGITALPDLTDTTPVTPDPVLPDLPVNPSEPTL